MLNVTPIGIYSLACQVGYQVSIKGSNHRYMQTKYVVINKKLVIARKHMLESKTKKDFSMSVLSPDMLCIWVLSYWLPHTNDVGSNHF